MSQAETSLALKRWYRTRPAAEFGDGEGISGDPRRFDDAFEI